MPQKIILPLLALALAGCKITETPPKGSCRDAEHGVLAREGLAFSRVITSPIQLPLTYAGLYAHYFDDGKPMRLGHTDPFSKGVSTLLCGSVKGPICICEELVVGLAEILTTAQFNSVIYPWETLGFYERSRNLKQDLEYINSPEMLEKRKQAELRLEKRALTAAAVAVEASGEVVEEAIEHAIDRAISGANDDDDAAQSEDGARTGYAIIKGPANLVMGKSARYQLCINGKSVHCEWSGGTSLTISQSGRVLAGNPPIKGGKFRTTLKARYNGKEYHKSIYIVK